MRPWSRLRDQRRSVPLALDAVPACGVAVQRRDEAEQAAVGAVSELMATRFDQVAGADVLAADAVAEDSGRCRRLERPDGRLAFVVLYVEVDERVRGDEDDLLDRAFDLDPFRDVVVRVAVMSERQRADNE